MNRVSESRRWTSVLIAMAVAFAALVIGAWQNHNSAPLQAASERSVFVQSGGAAADVDPGAADRPVSRNHARASGASAQSF
jgi:hypothetical protein